MITFSLPSGALTEQDYGVVARHSCNSGYYLDGSVLRTCSGNGITAVGFWNGAEPSCRGKFQKLLSKLKLAFVQKLYLDYDNILATN